MLVRSETPFVRHKREQRSSLDRIIRVPYDRNNPSPIPWKPLDTPGTKTKTVTSLNGAPTGVNIPTKIRRWRHLCFSRRNQATEHNPTRHTSNASRSVIDYHRRVIQQRHPYTTVFARAFNIRRLEQPKVGTESTLDTHDDATSRFLNTTLLEERVVINPHVALENYPGAGHGLTRRRWFQHDRPSKPR